MEDGSPLAVRTQTEEFQAMADVLEAVRRSDPGIVEIRQATFIEFHDLRAAGANEMVVMSLGFVLDEFETRGALPKVEPLHNPNFLEQSQGTVHGGQVAIDGGQGAVEFLDRQGAPVAAEDFEQSLAR